MIEKIIRNKLTLLVLLSLLIQNNYSFSQTNKKSEAQIIYEKLEKNNNKPSKKIDNKQEVKEKKPVKKQENKNNINTNKNDINTDKNNIKEIKKEENIIPKKEDVKPIVNKNIELENKLKEEIKNTTHYIINNEDTQAFLFLFLKRIEINSDILTKILETECSTNYRLCWEESQFEKFFEQINNYLKKEYDINPKMYSESEIKYFLINAFTIYDLLGKDNLENFYKINKNIKELNNKVFKDKILEIISKIKEFNQEDKKIEIDVKNQEEKKENYNLIFVSERDGKQGIYLFSEETGKELKLSKEDSYDYMPSLFPDKEKIVYVSENDGSTDIFILNINTKENYQLTFDSSSKYSPVVSPDGNKIVFVSNRDVSLDSTSTVLKINYKIYSMNIDGSDIKKLTDGDYSDESPRYSPNGSKIVFVSNRDGNKEIYVMNADGSEQKRLTYNNDSDIMPSWSPDGSKIVFVSNRDKNPEIYIMNADGSEQKRLTYSYFGSEYPVFSSDGKKIYFASKRDNNIDQNGIRTNKLYIMNSDGTNVKLLKSSDYNDYQPVILN